MMSSSATTAALVTTTQAIEALRTNAGASRLVANYTGGACDVDSELVAIETTTDIQLTIETRIGADQWCAAVGIQRVERLDPLAPVGDRTIRSGGERLTPFDGSSLLEPNYLPAGFVLVNEYGAGRLVGPDPVTARWDRMYAMESFRST